MTGPLNKGGHIAFLKWILKIRFTGIKPNCTMVPVKVIKFISIIIILLCPISIYAGFETVNQIPTPAGYSRINYPGGSYSHFLQNLALKKDNTIYKYNGKKVLGILYNVYAVVDAPLLFNSDLEQCADFCMRFWAEFHKQQNILNELYLFDYQGNRKYYKDSGKSFRSYLKWHMAYSNSYSIKKGAVRIEYDRLAPGDMYVQNKDGGIGHVSLIVDVAKNQENERVYLIGYGFIAAQEFHIEKAGSEHGTQGWFTTQGYRQYLSEFPFSRYGDPVLRRFE